MRLQHQAWMHAPAVTAIFQAVQNGETSPVLRFVGGCVRDALAGRPVADIDLATKLPPEEVMRRLRAAGLKAIPTGIDHGTVTAVARPGDGAVEITTLRKDVATFGRRAKVAFTDDWAADAARRDLTINALFADPDGTVYDYYGGVADLEAGRIRFVGPAARRITEDYLRILRFFRFYAQFGTPPPDAEALAACARLASNIDRLSGERVAKELLALLAAADPAPTVALMGETGVLAAIDPQLIGAARLAALVAVEAAAGVAGDPLRRLAALCGAAPAAVPGLVERLKPSRAVAERLRRLALRPTALQAGAPAASVRRLVYSLGAATVRDLALLAWAAARLGASACATDPPAAAAEAGWQAVLRTAADAPPPEFPLRGRDALSLGMAPGPHVGRLLAAVESWWVDGDYTADRAACLAELRRRAAEF